MKKLISAFSRHLVIPGIIVVAVFTFQGCEKDTLTSVKPAQPGCTDPLSTNFNPAATVSDGSCVYVWDQFIGSYTITSLYLSYVYAGDLKGVESLVIAPYPVHSQLVEVSFKGSVVSRFGIGYIQSNTVTVKGQFNNTGEEITIDLTLNEDTLDGRFTTNNTIGQAHQIGLLTATRED